MFFLNNITKTLLEHVYFFFCSKSPDPNLKYAALSFSHSVKNAVPNSMADYRGAQDCTGNTMLTETTVVSMTPSGKWIHLIIATF